MRVSKTDFVAHLNRIDAITGDGDCGSTFDAGARAVCELRVCVRVCACVWSAFQCFFLLFVGLNVIDNRCTGH